MDTTVALERVLVKTKGKKRNLLPLTRALLSTWLSFGGTPAGGSGIAVAELKWWQLAIASTDVEVVVATARPTMRCLNELCWNVENACKSEIVGSQLRWPSGGCETNLRVPENNSSTGVQLKLVLLDT